MTQERISYLEGQVVNLRNMLHNKTAPLKREPDEFVGIDVGTFSVAWARISNGIALDEFGTIPLRTKKEVMAEGRNALRAHLSFIVDCCTRNGQVAPTQVAIEEPMSMGFRSSKGMGVYKTMIEETLIARGIAVVEMVPSRWHAMVRSNASHSHFAQYHVIKNGRRVLDVKALAAKMAEAGTRNDSGRQQGVGMPLLSLTQDECDAFWIARRARFDYMAHRDSTAGEA